MHPGTEASADVWNNVQPRGSGRVVSFQGDSGEFVISPGLHKFVYDKLEGLWKNIVSFEMWRRAV